MVETAARCLDLEGAPRCTMEGPGEFFDRLDGASVRNVYYGELYLAWHRGTYTSQAGIKRGVRRAEYALREAEYLAGLLRAFTGKTAGFICMGIYLTGGFIMLSQITLLRSLSDFATAFQSMLRSSAVLIAESLILIFLLSVSSRIRQHHS